MRSIVQVEASCEEEAKRKALEGSGVSFERCGNMLAGDKTVDSAYPVEEEVEVPTIVMRMSKAMS
jgi:hypothetical protein